MCGLAVMLLQLEFIRERYTRATDLELSKMCV
jgi:hypothetical protein